tara:strand:- start:829 stop:1191 length:363 start_codon:yes stop_codon:yes gene_type:complete
MGNRATIEIQDYSGDAPAYIYLHWNGSPNQVTDVVKAAAPRMRKSDASYATARLIGELHNRIDGGLSLGVTQAKAEWRDQWDNGHYTIDLGAGRITQEWFADEDTTASAIVAEGIQFSND